MFGAKVLDWASLLSPEFEHLLKVAFLARKLLKLYPSTVIQMTIYRFDLLKNSNVRMQTTPLIQIRLGCRIYYLQYSGLGLENCPL